MVNFILGTVLGLAMSLLASAFAINVFMDRVYFIQGGEDEDDL